jgi:hypothetical protein
LPNTLNSGVSESVHRRNLVAQIQIALPLLWQVHASSSSVAAQQLHFTSLADALGYQMPSKPHLRLLLQAVALYHWPLVPRAKH